MHSNYRERRVEPLVVAQMVKNLPAVQEIQVQSLGQEDLLEKGMAIHSSILAWRILWTEEPGERQSMVSQRSVMSDLCDMTEQLALSLGLGNIHRMFGTGTDTW